MAEELQERDYLALSAIEDAPYHTLHPDNVGDIPVDIFESLQSKGLVYRRVVGWRITLAGREALAPYRQPAPAPQAIASPSATDDADWGVSPTDRELIAYGDGYTAGLTDGPDYTSLQAEIATLRAALDAAQEREAAVTELLTRIERHMPTNERCGYPLSMDNDEEKDSVDYNSIAYNAFVAGGLIRAYQQPCVVGGGTEAGE